MKLIHFHYNKRKHEQIIVKRRHGGENNRKQANGYFKI